jgi:uncharacterized protein with ParB-like and HNH nuclease domain
METKFEIDACVYCIKGENSKTSLLNTHTRYVIPIFQRPYSWTEKEITSLIKSIYNSYFENDNLFIGTMQLSYEKDNTQDVIDGQQRITTLYLLLKALSLKYHTPTLVDQLRSNYLTINTDNKIHQAMFDSVMSITKIENINEKNIYSLNLQYIFSLINDLLIDEENTEKDFEINKFINHLFSNLYFVVIKTNAGLSKTIEIFDAINTTGLDLDTSNIFKIRMYEYLKDKIGLSDEKAFNNINTVYELGVKYNLNIAATLGIYQRFLISAHNLPNEKYDYGQERFYDELFEDLLKKVPKHNIELKIEDIIEIIECRQYWETMEYGTLEDSLLHQIFEWSRYTKYTNIIFLFLKRFKNSAEKDRKLYDFLSKLTKLMSIYSVVFARSVGEMHRFMQNEIMKFMFTVDDGEDVLYNLLIEKINNKIKVNWLQESFTSASNGIITDNYKKKNIICRLNALLYEDYKDETLETIKTISKKFEGNIDIEHIEPWNNEDGTKREEIWRSWDFELNALGNLMILESDINRSIKNSNPSVKMNTYTNSGFAIVRHFSKNSRKWGREDAFDRRTQEFTKIKEYLFN